MDESGYGNTYHGIDFGDQREENARTWSIHNKTVLQPIHQCHHHCHPKASSPAVTGLRWICVSGRYHSIFRGNFAWSRTRVSIGSAPAENQQPAHLIGQGRKNDDADVDDDLEGW